MDASTPIPDAELERFADAVISIANRIEPRGLDLPGRRRLTPREILVLHEVAVTPGVTATQIARSIDLQRSNVSATLHALERESLLVRAPAADGRGAGFTLTEEARRDVAVVRAHRSERLRTASVDLVREVVSISDALSHLARAIGEDPRGE